MARRIPLKAVTLLIGLSLFVTEISYKFYQRASMPVINNSANRHSHPGYGLAREKSTQQQLSLDKRFDPNLSIPLPTPFIFFNYPGSHGAMVCCFPDRQLPVREMTLIALRGPPFIRGGFF